jgi:sulfide dehydrogenase [flavocytochrome c] flavoprotein subunit
MAADISLKLREENMSDKITRRDFVKISGLAAGLGAIGSVGCASTSQAVASESAKAPMVGSGVKADLPPAKGPRLVVVGAGTSGLTIAKYAKKNYPKFDVVVVDKRDMYSSCFNSSLWYAGIIDLEFLADHSFLDAAVNNNYIYFNSTVIGLDRTSRKVITSDGEIDYDYALFAPGISYDYERSGVTDSYTRNMLKQKYPGGFISPMEHVTIKRKIDEFDGGIFVQNVPAGNYRCLPGPYERACIIADIFKKNKIKGKVLVLDGNPEITIKAKGFHAAFDELYKDIIEWKPSSDIKGVDVDKKIITTEFDSYPFDDACIYPHVRGNTLLEQCGLMAGSERSTQKEANIDTRFYNLIGDDRVYCSGDSRYQPYSKSANTSNTEGHFVAKVLAARAQGKEIPWETPETVCYSMVEAYPPMAIGVIAHYVYDPKKDAITGFSPDTKTFEDRNEARGKTYLEWAKGIYRDTFS